jgi:hypothetical protein
MSQILQALVNVTNLTILYKNYDGSTQPQEVLLPPMSMFRTNGKFNIPDNSNPCQYWSTQHSELVNVQNGGAIFSFWDDDHQNYNIFYMMGNNCKNQAIPMPGGNGGNGATVGIIFSPAPPPTNFAIIAISLINV